MVNFIEDLFIGIQELKNLQEFQQNNITNLAKFVFKEGGISEDSSKPLSVFVSSGKLTLKKGGAAINDSEGNFKIISLKEDKEIIVPSDSNFYWIKLKYKKSAEEKGTVSVSSNGILTGVGTEFTKVLRSQPFPTLIKLSSLLDNDYEYEVSEVISDTNAKLSGEFTAEQNIRYEVLGTLTPGIDFENGYTVYSYDDFEVVLVPEQTVGVKPTILNADKEFYVARVKKDSSTGNYTVEDKRELFLKGFDYNDIDLKQSNIVIGIERIQSITNNSYLPTVSAAKIGFTIRIANYFYSSNSVEISGEGGVFKANNGQFSNNQFLNWRLYFTDGSWTKITATTATSGGNSINLELEILRNDKVPYLITPNVDEIEIEFNYGSTVERIETKLLPISTEALYYSFDKSEFDGDAVSVRYRYKQGDLYGVWTAINVNEYYGEDSFDSKGILINSPTSTTSNKVILSDKTYNKNRWNVLNNCKIDFYQNNAIATNIGTFNSKHIEAKVFVSDKTFIIKGAFEFKYVAAGNNYGGFLITLPDDLAIKSNIDFQNVCGFYEFNGSSGDERWLVTHFTEKNQISQTNAQILPLNYFSLFDFSTPSSFQNGDNDAILYFEATFELF